MTSLETSASKAPLPLIKGNVGNKEKIQHPSSIFLRKHSNDSRNRIDTESIIMIKSDSNYSIIFLSSGKSILTSRTLKHWSGLLNGENFIRCHASYLINKNFIKSVDVKNHTFTLINDHICKVGRSHWREIKHLLRHILIF